jgi:tetratricopeptide (TPR) repeat protein
MGDRAEYARYTRKGLDLSAELVAKYPRVTAYKDDLVVGLMNMAEALISQGQLPEARGLLKDAITHAQALHKSHPDNPRYPSFIVPGSYILARIDAGLGQNGEGSNLRQEADILFGNTWKQLLATRGRSSAGLFCADMGRELQEIADAWEKAGNHQEMANAYEAAIKFYDQAIEIDPTNGPAAHNDLAWILATCPDRMLRDARKAVELAKKAVVLAPKEGTHWNTLGAAHYRAGEWEPAITALQKSMELRNGGDSLEWFFLATAHWQLGQKEEARKWYDKAVAWMEKNQPKDEQLGRFRAEAASLLKTETKNTPK